MKTAWMLVEIGRKATSSCWATTGENALAPNGDWGTGVEGHAQILYVNDSKPLQPIEARSPREHELNKPRPGSYSELKVVSELNVGLEMFGERLIGYLRERVAGFGDLLHGANNLERVEVSDRYIKSPSNAALVYRFLDALRKLSGGIGGATRIHVRTESVRDYGRPNSSYFNNDWESMQQQRRVLQEVFSPLRATVEVLDKRAKAIQHYREVRLSWPQRTLTLRFDQGLGFVQPERGSRWDFGESESAQATRLREFDVPVKQEAGSQAIIYVHGPV